MPSRRESEYYVCSFCGKDVHISSAHVFSKPDERRDENTWYVCQKVIYCDDCMYDLCKKQQEHNIYE